jgi:hypothetical protein
MEPVTLIIVLALSISPIFRGPNKKDKTIEDNKTTIEQTVATNKTTK